MSEITREMVHTAISIVAPCGAEASATGGTVALEGVRPQPGAERGARATGSGGTTRPLKKRSKAALTLRAPFAREGRRQASGGRGAPAELPGRTHDRLRNKRRDNIPSVPSRSEPAGHNVRPAPRTSRRRGAGGAELRGRPANTGRKTNVAIHPIPFSYFCTCWNVKPSASPSFPG